MLRITALLAAVAVSVTYWAEASNPASGGGGTGALGLTQSPQLVQAHDAMIAGFVARYGELQRGALSDIVLSTSGDDGDLIVRARIRRDAHSPTPALFVAEARALCATELSRSACWSIDNVRIDGQTIALSQN